MRAAKQRETILNVDDNEAARYAKGRMLAEGGYEVVEAATGMEALEKVVERKPDLVLLDVGLPNIDGIEVCRRLKSSRETALIPVVHVSASFVESSDRVRGLEGGADAYLVAPLDSRVLLATVRALLRARRAEAALRASEDRFRSLADAASVLIWICDHDRQRTWVNRAWLEFTGREREQELGQGWLEGIHPDDRESSCAARDAAFAAPEEYRIEFRLRRGDGEYRWLLEEGRPLYEADDRFAGYIGSCVDIHDRYAREEERKSLLVRERAAREESDRLNRVKDDFLATLSHELRTPLNAILGWTQVLRAQNHLPEDVAQAIERIERSARAQARIIEDLLEVSRIVSGKVRLTVKPIDLGGLVSAAVESVRMAADAKGLRIDLTTDPSLPPIIGDSDRLQQVAWNLLTNALKFSPRDARILVDVKRDGDDVVLRVRDFGQGIDPEFMPHLFERFRQADSTAARTQSGLGLGLSIVKSLVELHGGTVEATSDGPGKGATFVVRLPQHQTFRPEETDFHRLSESAELPSLPDTSALRGMTILVVDDDAESRAILDRMLSRASARVLCASGALEALQLVRTEAPDFVLSDIGMPEIDGYEFIRRLRASGTAGARVPALALTAFARDADRSRALEAGFQGHLPKPIEPRELFSQIGALKRVSGSRKQEV